MVLNFFNKNFFIDILTQEYPGTDSLTFEIVFLVFLTTIGFVGEYFRAIFNNYITGWYLSICIIRRI